MRTITITNLLIILTFSIFSSYGQVTISGKVISDEDKEGMCYVTIREKGTDNFTFSDSIGNFKLQITDFNSIVEVSYMGFKTKEVTVGETRYFIIKLKVDCFIDFFDQREIWLGLSSDPINNPMGGFFHITHPFFRMCALIGEIGYQSDFADNYKMDAKLGMIHLFAQCYYNADLDFNFRNIKIVDKFQFKSYTVESVMSFSHPRYFPIGTILYLGYGLSDFNTLDFSFANQVGYMLGIGTYIGIGTYTGFPLVFKIGAKTVYWTNFWEWKGEIAIGLERVVASVEFDTIDSSFSMGIKIGYRFGYSRIFK